MVAILLLSGVLVSTAHAYNTASGWNSSGTPLTKTGYSSTARAYGHVKVITGTNGTRLYNYAWNKFTDADNHRAYLRANSQFNAGSCRSSTPTTRYKGVSVASSSNCARQFYTDAAFSRAEGLNYTHNSSWVTMPTRSVAVHSGADRARAAVTVCIDVPLRPDPCSGTSYSASDSY